MWSLLAAAAVLLTCIVAVLLSPIVLNITTLPPAYPARRSDHPPSPFYPPRYDLKQEQIDAFRSDGMVVLRDVLPPDLAAKMDLAGHDLMANATRHCEMTKFTGPPIFHGYDRYCGRAQLVHDYLRDVAYRGALTHVAAQLLGMADDEPMRQLADIFMGGGNLPQRWHTDFPAFALFTNWKGKVPCHKGLVFWMPLERSYEERNGMVFLNGSSKLFAEHFPSVLSTTETPLAVLQWINGLPKDDYVAPSLELGDVIAFDQCTVHSTSGKHSGGARRAYQLRFITDFDISNLKDNFFKGIKLPLGPPVGPGLGVASPQLWPHTLESEDRIRSSGHVIYTRKEWIDRVKNHPTFSLLTSAIALKAKLFGDPGGGSII